MAEEKSKGSRKDRVSASLSPDHAEEYLNVILEDAVPTRGYRSLPMVGLGGSAGSIPALQRFFEAVPADSGMVYVVVLHLSPDHESILPEILQRASKIPVLKIDEFAKVEVNKAYVIPPGKALVSADGYLKLSELPKDRGKRVAVDLFFRTLAETHGPHATAIVLSGADSDGSIGVKRIKERGGLTIAQDPTEAEYADMPRGAIATGMVDWVLRSAEMPARLIEYSRQERKLRLPPEEGPARVGARKKMNQEKIFREILGYLRARTSRDFSCYKRATILRRLARRMQVNGKDDLAQYLAFLRTNPGENTALLKELLISVTNFFRDRDAFEALEKQVPDLFRDKTQNDTVRVWVAGCATGEEAYSIAMFLHEHARTLEGPPHLQVFATDLDEAAIQAARNACYPEVIEADVSSDRLRHFFSKEAGSYRVRREIRETVLFAPHDLLEDSPFSRLDLVSCRNLLIYLNHAAQVRVLNTFHFSLRDEGKLFLGTSESIDGVKLFIPVDPKHRIYIRKAVGRPTFHIPAGASALGRVLEAQQRTKEFPVLSAAAANPANLASAFSHKSMLGEARSLSTSDMHFKMLERLGPPSIVIDQAFEIVHISESAGRFLKFSSGEPTNQLLRVIDPALRAELSSALYRSRQTGESMELPKIAIDLNGEPLEVIIEVAIAPDFAPDLMLVTFDVHKAVRSTNAGTISSTAQEAANHVENELERMRAHLRNVVEQYERSTEDLKASNEELQAINEELRSATEELETSREELQSINEELTTVNLELKSNVEELAHTNSDLQNLIGSTNIATIFLSRDLHITLYTPATVGLFSLISTDIGRPIMDIRTKLDYPCLEEDAAEVIAQLVPKEREVRTTDQWFLARLFPYRTMEDRIAGAVLVFIDITARKTAEAKLEEALLQTQSARRAAETSDAAKDHFLAVLSHELRTPLTPVLMGVQLLGKNETLSAPEKNIIEMIRRNIRIETALIDDLLDITRIGRGKLKLDVRSVNVHAVIKIAVDISREDFAAKQVALEIALNATRVEINGDAHRIEQAMWNVLKNAAKFTPHGGKVQIVTQNVPGKIVITVTDSGIGVHPDVLPVIFDTFTQGGETVTRRFGGLGLGLAISKASIEAHEGHIRAESDGEGHGTMITIELPLPDAALLS